MCTWGKRCFKARHQIEEILEWKIGMQAADDVKLRHRLGVAGGCGLPRFFEGHGVGPFAAFSAAKGTQPAGGHTNVGGIDVPVDIEISDVAVQAFAHMIGQPAYRQNISRPVEGDAIVEIEALARQNFFGDRAQTGVVGLKAVPLRRKRHEAAHFVYDTRPPWRLLLFIALHQKAGAWDGLG